MTNSAFAQPSPDAVLDRLMQFARAAGKPFAVPPTGHAGPPADQPPPSQAQSAPRSEAQREASRRNGSKSRGPVTREGRARSVLNGTKHGIFARLIRPDDDGREFAALFDETVNRLRAEYPIRRLEVEMLIDEAAMLRVQLARAHAVHRRASLGRLHPSDATDTVSTLRTQIDAADKLATFRFSLPNQPALAPTPSVANALVYRALNARRDLALTIRAARNEDRRRRALSCDHHRQPSIAPGSSSPGARLSVSAMRCIARHIRPLRAMLRDERRLRAIVNCAQPIDPDLTSAWSCLANWLVPSTITEQAELERHLPAIEAADDSTVDAFVASIDLIDRVQGYEARIRRELQKTFQRLADLHNPPTADEPAPRRRARRPPAGR